MANTQALQKIVKFYREKITAYGVGTTSSVNWNSFHTQFMRFKVLCDIGDLNGASILDFGCGNGDLYAYLQMRFRNVTYLGVDIVEEFIQFAKQRWGESEFLLISNEIPKEEFDYIIASGAFSYNYPGAVNDYLITIKSLFAKSRRGMAFNVLSDKFEKSNGPYLAYDIGFLEAEIKKITSKYEIIDGYLPNDITIHMLR